ncbi:MAG: hypothetical protein KGP12_12085 [Actinomycetales bacterium]|nr:hypothetical protein [Actinomycetales bacterium]
MSAIGQTAALPWAQARHIAANADPLAPVLARLDEAAGHALAEPIRRMLDDPATDLAAQSGYAVRGKGPWALEQEATRQPGHCHLVRVGDLLEAGTVAVLTMEQTESERTRSGGVRVLARDALTGLPDSSARATPDEGIIRKGSWASAGEILVPAEPGPVTVTATMLALAAAAGHDALTVIRPPTVSTIVIGNALQGSGVPRPGRVREALGEAIPAYAMQLGARALPSLRSLDDEREVRGLVEDANADIIITVGALADTRGAVADLAARWLIDGVAVSPGGAMVMARLTDDRILIGLPGEPVAALVGMLTLLGPVITALRGSEPAPLATAILSTAVPPPPNGTDTSLVPVALVPLEGRTFATPVPAGGPAQLLSWANANAIAVVAPGVGYRDDVIELLALGASVITAG